MTTKGYDIYSRKQNLKLLLFFAAIIIGASSLSYTSRLVKDLSIEERKKVELWAEATRILINAEPELTDLSFPLSVIQNNTTVPVILTDSSGKILTYNNLDSVRVSKPQYLEKQFRLMRENNDSIIINLTEGDKNYIFYGTSILLNRLKYFPYIQLAVIVLFVLVSYLAFSSSRKAEQNKVWTGLSKETAHQLGTPTSSLNAWVEILKDRPDISDIVKELEKDTHRLTKITDRFSKIGSRPALHPAILYNILNESIQYLKSRSSDKIIFDLQVPDKELKVNVNTSLFEWVIENTCKNAMDALDGNGTIKIIVNNNPQQTIIDISDNGKGIPKSRFKTIFKPGFTTKQRGWGLGLSLSKRIIEEYHRGKIFILRSDINKGTTIRIVLNNF